MFTRKKNRLTSLLSDFARSFELPFKLDSDGEGADLGIPVEKNLIFVGYRFDPSEDSYEYAAALGKVGKDDIPSLSIKLLQSTPIRGITERLDQDGKILVLGGRDGLQHTSDSELKRAFMDDISRIAKYSEKLSKILKES